MTGLISALVATATALVGIGIATAKGDIFKSAPWWVVPALFVAAGVLYVLALALGIVHWKRERKKESSAPPPSPPPPFHQEQKQSVNQTFNFGVEGLKAVTPEQDGDARSILAFMKRVRPAGFYTLEEIATALHFTPRQTLDALERLERDKSVYRSPMDIDGGAVWRLEDIERMNIETPEVLPPIRPIIVPTRYGKIESGPEAGHTGIALRNDGEPAYTVTPPERVEIPGVGRLIVWGTPRNLRRGELDLSFPVLREAVEGSSLGGQLYAFMVEHRLDTITIPFKYRDANEVFYQTDVIVIKDQMARSVDGSESGLRLEWKQKRISKP